MKGDQPRSLKVKVAELNNGINGVNCEIWVDFLCEKAYTKNRNVLI